MRPENNRTDDENVSLHFSHENALARQMITGTHVNNEQLIS